VWDKDQRRDNGFTQLRRLAGSLPGKGSCSRIAKALKDFIAILDIPALLAEEYRCHRLPLSRLKAALKGYEAVVETDGILDSIEQEVAILGDPDRSFTLGKYLELFRKAVAAARPLNLERQGEGVQVVSPARVRGTAFRAVYILGLTAGEFPLRARENWLYDDRDRAAFNDLGLDIPTAVSRRLEEDLYFAVAAALADELLVVSCREDSETMPSPYVDEVVRLFAKGAVPIEKYSVSELFPADYDAVYSPQELAGRALLDAFGCLPPSPLAPAAARYVLAQLVDGDFARRLAAEAERAGDEASGYDGLIGGSDSKNQFSITALEDYALCPFAYFAKRLLGLDDWAEKEEEAGFDIVGIIYHEALAGFLRVHAGEILRPEQLEDYSGELLTIVAAIFDRLIADKTIVAGKLWEYQRQRLEKVLRRWLEYEIGEQNSGGLAFAPSFFEWGFGLPLKAGMDGASATSPLTLDCGGKLVNIVGKVDRIDKAGNKLAVIDYKRKGCPSYRKLAQGIDLQAALYILAVERFLCPPGGEVAGGGYYSVEARKKEGGMWRAECADDIRHRAAKRDGNLGREDWAAVQDRVRQQVLRCVEGIASGRFSVNPAADCPPYCVASEICRYRKHKLTKKAVGGDNDGC
jgi:ATP-dependent helicase/nuclease subunit B